MVVALTLPGNPFDGHTLAGPIAQTERIIGLPIERAYVDRGYRGHDADKVRVFVSGQKRGVTPTKRRETRRLAAVEPVIGHLKEGSHLGRNFLAGVTGDAWLIPLFAFLLGLISISGPMAPPCPVKRAAP